MDRSQEEWDGKLFIPVRKVESFWRTGSEKGKVYSVNYRMSIPHAGGTEPGRLSRVPTFTAWKQGGYNIAHSIPGGQFGKFTIRHQTHPEQRAETGAEPHHPNPREIRGGSRKNGRDGFQGSRHSHGDPRIGRGGLEGCDSQEQRRAPEEPAASRIKLPEATGGEEGNRAEEGSGGEEGKPAEKGKREKEGKYDEEGEPDKEGKRQEEGLAARVTPSSVSLYLFKPE